MSTPGGAADPTPARARDSVAGRARRLRTTLGRARRVSRQLWACRRLSDLDLATGAGKLWPWGGPLNGQRGRQELVRRIAREIDFGAAIETGTWRGSSTGFLADVLGCPVWTVEADPVAQRFAGRTLAGRNDVQVVAGDSRRFLAGFDAHDRAAATFFYLDSHWDPCDFPLWDELDLVFGRWARPVVMIDDFRVMGDPGYAYDDYGPGNSLEPRDLAAHLPRGVAAFAPTWPSTDETGARRGCCVLSGPELVDRLPGDLLVAVADWPAPG